jgi:hypothetical protein
VSGLGLGLLLALCGLTLAWAGLETFMTHRRLNALEARLGAIEARQSRLQRVVERGWSQSLDLTSFDWSRQSEVPPPPEDDGTG